MRRTLMWVVLLSTAIVLAGVVTVPRASKPMTAMMTIEKNQRFIGGLRSLLSRLTLSGKTGGWSD